MRAGVAVLGRGGSAMPAQHVAGLGPKAGLMQLASEAVRVAAQSPFLERAASRATAVLCCVYLPDRGLPSPGAACLGWQCCSWNLLSRPTQCPCLWDGFSNFDTVLLIICMHSDSS